MKFLIFRLSAALVFTVAFVSYSRVTANPEAAPVYERNAPKTLIELSGHDQFIHHPAIDQLQKKIGPYRAPMSH